MQIRNRQLLVLGDRLLIRPEESIERTKVGLYLPQTVVDKEPVLAGRVVETGPGIPIPNFAAGDSEPWQKRTEPVRYLPLQVEIGDFVLFLRKDAVEVRFDGEPFLVVPQGAVLLVVRGEDPLEGEASADA